MLTKLPLLIVPTVLASVAAIAMAAPKPVPPPQPQAVPLMPPLQPYHPKPDGIRSVMPNMTQMPNSHLIAAFAVTASGRGLVMDNSGKVIGERELAKPSHIVWHDDPLPKAAPKPKH